MADIFSPVETDDNQIDNPLEVLVGEGKKFADVSALAKAKLEADNFIKQIERENAELRAKVSSQATVDEIMTQIKTLAPRPAPVEPHNEPPKANPATPEELEQVVASLLEKRTAADRISKNRQTVEEKVLEKWGSDAQININKKAKELNVSVDYLQKVASDSPSVFFRLVGLDQTPAPVAPVVAPRSNQQISPQPTGGEKRTQAYYNGLKSRDFKTYISPKVQNQMMKDALQLGEGFFDV
jgi:hypothetical protein